jgi:ribosome-associated protein
MSEPLSVTSRVTIPASDLAWTSVRASGPGGQNVNKVASKVELRFDLEATRAIDQDAKARLRRIAATRIDAEGRIVVTSQKTRDQRRNLEDARDKLRSMIALALERPKKRRPTAPTFASKRERVADKRHRAAVKRGRRADAGD